MVDESGFDTEIKHEFLNEAGELVEDIESALLELEKDPESGDAIDQIFRCAHTVKGSAYAAGFNHLAEFGHVFETLLGLLRSGKAIATPAIVDVLLNAVDVTKEYVEVLTDDIDGYLETDEIVGELKVAIEDIDGPIVEKKDDLPAFGFFDDDDDEEPAPAAAAAEPVKKAEEKKAPSNPAVQTATVLIVDDDEGVLAVLSEIVESVPDCRVVVAEDGEEGLEKFKAGGIDIVLSDLNMPKLDGLAMIDKIREVDKNVPICMISGHANRDNIITLISQGVYAFIDKPFDANMIMLTVENALKVKRTKDGLSALGKANFKAFISMNRHLAKYQSYDKETLELEEANLKKDLDQIAVLTNYLVKL